MFTERFGNGFFYVVALGIGQVLGVNVVDAEYAVTKSQMKSSRSTS
jgi:hypothetical protein